MSLEKYTITPDDMRHLADLGGMDVTITKVEAGIEDEKRRAKDTVNTLAMIAIQGNMDEFCQYVESRATDILKLSDFDKRITDVVLIGYRMGVSNNHAGCANNLGALYYMGQLVKQDYAAAAELYEAAMEWGCYQSIINLGYIYEYGRVGKPDYQKAFEYYALAAALTSNYEALYKLGDMYARGKAVEFNENRAMMLWEQSFNVAEGLMEVAHPAIRIADVIWVEEPMRALALYQNAEVGLRLAIENGQTYYRGKLKEAMEGQQRVREFLDFGVEGSWE